MKMFSKVLGCLGLMAGSLLAQPTLLATPIHYNTCDLMAMGLPGPTNACLDVVMVMVDATNVPASMLVVKVEVEGATSVQQLVKVEAVSQGHWSGVVWSFPERVKVKSWEVLAVRVEGVARSGN